MRCLLTYLRQYDGPLLVCFTACRCGAKVRSFRNIAAPKRINIQRVKTASIKSRFDRFTSASVHILAAAVQMLKTSKSSARRHACVRNVRRSSRRRSRPHQLEDRLVSPREVIFLEDQRRLPSTVPVGGTFVAWCHVQIDTGRDGGQVLVVLHA